MKSDVKNVDTRQCLVSTFFYMSTNCLPTQESSFNKRSVSTSEAFQQAKHFNKQSVSTSEAFQQAKRFNKQSVSTSEALQQAKRFNKPSAQYPKISSISSAFCSSRKTRSTKFPLRSRSIRMCFGEGIRQCLIPPYPLSASW